MDKILLTITTMPDIESAKQLAYLLIKDKYCGCVNIIPKVMSIYFWENNIEHAEECLLYIKSDINNKVMLLEMVKKQHPYSVPEILQLEAQANQDYANWLNQ